MGYAIKTENLIKRYKDKTAVDGLHLSVKEGELIVVVGVTGAGPPPPVPRRQDYNGQDAYMSYQAFRRQS